jgi:hypothetical protein
VHAGEFSDEDFFRTLQASGARALLIGRRAMIALGAPVMTADYDLWLHRDDVEALNAAFDAVAHLPNRSPSEARSTGRYVLENGEHIDVMIAKAATTPSGTTLAFEDAWARRVMLTVLPGVSVALPCIEDLILTKEWGSRPRDLADIAWLGLLKARS